MKKLKPCPFCGSQKSHLHFAPAMNAHLMPTYFVVCENCSAHGSEFKYLRKMDNLVAIKSMAIEAWNRRSQGRKV